MSIYQANYDTPAIVYCARCNGSFHEDEDMAKTGPDEFWHLECFVCAQCFRPFNENNEYYEFCGQKYCERDYRNLFAPCCNKCDKFIMGRFIRAMNKSWHPNCFVCHLCQESLAEHGFIKSQGRALCHECHAIEKAAAKDRYVCRRCKGYIDEPPLKIKQEPYHSYHFNCFSCGIELRPDARQVQGELYCLKCHDKLDIPVCGACRRPIEERVVTALGKQFHVEHFVCAICDRPFMGKLYYESKGLAYCDKHYPENEI